MSTMIFPSLRGYVRLGNSQDQRRNKILAFVIALIGTVLLGTVALSVVESPSTSVSLTWAGRQPISRDWTIAGESIPGVDAAGWKKPEELRKIVALVFYGRRASVSVLDCYLKRNLVSNGGLLDEVIFLVRTDVTADLEWLDQLVEEEPLYNKHIVEQYEDGYGSAYDVCEDDVMYVKIDDDIVFLEDHTIPTLVRTRWEHPEYFVVSANVINMPALSWVHHHQDAVRPYLPEMKPSATESQTALPDWRASSLPAWSGSYDFDVELWKPEHTPHRWLPLPIEANKTEAYYTALGHTPIMETQYDAFSNGLYRWTIAAQQHYSFFENLEKEELWRYRFKIWDFHGHRMGIQFIAMMGSDINAAKPIEKDDEGYFTQAMPGWGRRAVVAGGGLAVHYSFNPQIDGMKTTDVLARYRSLAAEFICLQRENSTLSYQEVLDHVQ